MAAHYRLSQVFVAGGRPTVTYVRRANSEIETAIADYLGEAGHPLLVVGPRKSGKTVLLHAIARGIWVAGGGLRTIDDFWSEVVDALGVHTGEVVERTIEEREDCADGHSGAAKLGGSGVESSSARTTSSGNGRRHAQSRSRSSRYVAKQALRRCKPPLIVDDFEKVAPTLQHQIADELKDLLFDGVPAVFVAASTAGRDRRSTRVAALRHAERVVIDEWSPAELEQIAAIGLEALNAACDPALSRRLAVESHRSPCMMQYLCLQICKCNGMAGTLDRRQVLRVGRGLDLWVAHQVQRVLSVPHVAAAPLDERRT